MGLMALFGSAPRPGGAALAPLVAAQGVSWAGTQVTALALPALAVLGLGARPLVAAALFALQYGAQALASPVLGLLVDSVRSRRSLLVAADAAHAAVIASVPVAHWAGQLSWGLLFAVAALSGMLSALTAIATQALVPALVPADGLVRANAALSGAQSLGTVAGLAAGGWLIEALGGAVAMLVDAVSYGLALIACLALPSVPRTVTHSPAKPARHPISQGLATIRRYPQLSRIAIAAAALNLGGSALGGLYSVFAYRTLRVSPGALGLAGAASAVAALISVAGAPRVVRALGLTRLVPVVGPAAAASLLLIPAAAVLPAVPTLVAYEAAFAYCVTLWTISTASLQQSLVPSTELGRVSALFRTMTVTAIPVGALGGGALADVWGVLPATVVGALVALAGTAAVLGRSAARRPDEPPEPDERLVRAAPSAGEAG